MRSGVGVVCAFTREDFELADFFRALDFEPVFDAVPEVDFEFVAEL